jgi:hypothetical protein
VTVGAVGALVAGAVITFVVTQGAALLSARRTRSAEWRDHRLRSYAAFSSAMKAMTLPLYRVGARHRVDGNPFPMDWVDAHKQMIDLYVARDAAFEQIILFCDRPTLEASWGWRDSVQALIAHAVRLDQGEPADPAAWAQLVRICNDRRVAFHREARRDLGFTDIDLVNSRDAA